MALWVERLCQKHIIIFAKMLTSFFFYLKKELWVHLKKKREGIASLSFVVVCLLISLCFGCVVASNDVAFCMRTRLQQNLWSALNSLHSLSLYLVNSPWHWGRRRAKWEWKELVKSLFSFCLYRVKGLIQCLNQDILLLSDWWCCCLLLPFLCSWEPILG